MQQYIEGLDSDLFGKKQKHRNLMSATLNNSESPRSDHCDENSEKSSHEVF